MVLTQHFPKNQKYPLLLDGMQSSLPLNSCTPDPDMTSPVSYRKALSSELYDQCQECGSQLLQCTLGWFIGWCLQHVTGDGLSL